MKLLAVVVRVFYLFAAFIFAHGATHLNIDNHIGIRSTV